MRYKIINSLIDLFETVFMKVKFLLFHLIDLFKKVVEHVLDIALKVKKREDSSEIYLAFSYIFLVIFGQLRQFIPTITFLIIIVILVTKKFLKKSLVSLRYSVFYFFFFSPGVAYAITSLLGDKLFMSYSSDIQIVIQYVIFCVLYFMIAVYLVAFGDNTITKRTSILSIQLMTIIFLVISVVVNFFPISSFDNIYKNQELLKYIHEIIGSDSRVITHSMIQFFLAPFLIVAILMYSVFEIKEHLRYKQVIKKDKKRVENSL